MSAYKFYSVRPESYLLVRYLRGLFHPALSILNILF